MNSPLRKITTQFLIDPKGYVTGAKEVISKTKSITYSTTEAAAAFDEAFGDMDKAMKMTSQELEAHLIKIKKIEKESKKNEQAYAKTTNSLKKQYKMLSMTNEQQEVYVALQSLGAKATDAQKVEVEELVMAQQRLVKETKIANRTTESQAAASKKATSSFEQLSNEYKHLTARTGQSAERQERMNALQRLGTGATLTQKKAILQLVQAQQAQVASSGNVQKSMRGMRGQAQNIGWQLQDIAVQAQMGTNALIIFGQQGSQLASGFGAKGALIGAGIAVGSAALGVLMKAMGGTGEQSKELEERMKSLTDSIIKLNDAGKTTDLEQSMNISKATDNIKEQNRELVKLTKNLAKAKLEAKSKVTITYGISGTVRSDPKSISQQKADVDSIELKTKAIIDLNKKIKANQDIVNGANDENIKAETTAKKLIESLAIEVGMYGKSTEEIKLQKLALAGLSEEKLINLRSLYETKKALDEQAKKDKKLADEQKANAKEKIDAEKKAAEAKIKATKANEDYVKELQVELHILGLSKKQAIDYRNAQEAMASLSPLKVYNLLTEMEAIKKRNAEDKRSADIAKRNIKTNSDLVSSFVYRTKVMGKSESQVLALEKATELEGFAARQATKEEKKLTAAYYDRKIAAAIVREESQAAADAIAASGKNATDAEIANSKRKEKLNKIAKYDPSVKLQLLTEQYKQERELLEGNVIALQNIDEAYANERIKINGSYWEQYAQAAKENLGSFDDQVANSLDRFSAGFGNAVGNAVFESDNLSEAMGDVFKGAAKSMISFYAEMAIQRGIMWALDVSMSEGKNALSAKEVAVLTATETAKSAIVVAAAIAERAALLPLRLAGATSLAVNAQAMAVQGSLAAFASTAAIPLVGPTLAPPAAAAALAAGQAMATTVGNIAFAGAFDKGGLIPSGSAGIVAELGDELVGGTMVYNGSQSSLGVTGREDTARMSGNTSNNISVNSYGDASPAAIARALERMLKKPNKSVDNSVYDAMNRGRKNKGKRFA